jgi:hypothetical protein
VVIEARDRPEICKIEKISHTDEVLNREGFITYREGFASPNNQTECGSQVTGPQLESLGGKAWKRMSVDD